MSASPRSRRVVLSCLMASVLVLTGCSAGQAADMEGGGTAVASTTPLSELEFLESPREYVGSSTAVLPTESITARVGDVSPALPVTVTSHDPGQDSQVTVTDTDRVLAMDMSGSIAATVFALGQGDTLVGRDISTTFPEAEDLPIVTSSAHSVNAETVMSLRPSVVITDGSIGPSDVVMQLRDAGITLVFVDNDPSPEGASELARQVGAALGVPSSGEELATVIAADIAAKIAEIAAIAPSGDAEKLRMVFLYLRGASGIYYMFGEESGAHPLIEALGGIDIASENGWSGMKPMTDEAMISANPDVILVMSSGMTSVGGPDGLVTAKPAIGLTRAGANQRFVDMADGDILSFGPRSAAILDSLARAIYAPGQ